MDLSTSLAVIALLIIASAFFSIAEISLAAARPLKLRQLAEDGDIRAERVLHMQQQPGPYFTVVQIGLNLVAILGGITGEGAFSPHFAAALAPWLGESAAQTAGFVLSVALITALFLVFADLFPKRLGMVEPEWLALRVISPMQALMTLMAPAVWLFGRVTDALFRLLGLPQQREDKVTPADILALTEAGARTGALDPQEQQVIENLFELDTRTVSSVMTPRDRIAWFRRDEPDAQIRMRIAAAPYSTYPVCDGELDRVVGYVDARDLFQRVLNGQPIDLQRGDLVRRALVIPDRLSLAEVLTQFRQVHEDFAVIVNEYATVVGVVTLNDVMSTVMGELVAADAEELIMRRDAHSWLIDGLAPIQEVARALDLDPDDWPQREDYETLAGFLMTMLRRVPRRTDSVHWGGFRFEVMDVDSHRVDQVLVSRGDDAALTTPGPAASGQPAAPAAPG